MQMKCDHINEQANFGHGVFMQVAVSLCTYPVISLKEI